MDTNTGSSSGYQGQPISLETHLVRRHWTPTGAEPTDRWMDGWIINFICVSVCE